MDIQLFLAAFVKEKTINEEKRTVDEILLSVGSKFNLKRVLQVSSNL